MTAEGPSRVTDLLAAKVEAAMGKLPVLDVERKTFSYEVAPGMKGGSFVCMVFLFLPVKGTESDHVGQSDPSGIDPYAPQTEVDRLVRVLYEAGVKQRDTLEGQLRQSALAPGR